MESLIGALDMNMIIWFVQYLHIRMTYILGVVLLFPPIFEMAASKQLHQKLLEQKKKHKEEMKELSKMKDEGEEKMKYQLQQKLLEQDKKHKEEEEADQDSKIDELEKKTKDQGEKLEEQEKKLRLMGLNRKFEIKKFLEIARKRRGYWESPFMYTREYGYKFCIIVDGNGLCSGQGKFVTVHAVSMPGKFDAILKWPVRVKITIQLTNQQGGENAWHSVICTWKKPTGEYGGWDRFDRNSHGFLDHLELNSFLEDDTFYFFVSEVTVL